MSSLVNPQLAIFTHQHFVKRVSDGVLDQTVLFDKIRAHGKVEPNLGGTQYAPGIVRTAQHSIGGWSGLTQPPIAQPQLGQQWSLQWGGYIGQYLITDWDLWSNKGDEAIAKMYDVYEEALEDDFLMQFEADCFNDGTQLDPPTLAGLPAFMKNTGTYAGLPQNLGTGVYPANTWAPFVLDLTQNIQPAYAQNPYRAIQRMRIRSIRGRKQTGPMNEPTFIMTTPAMFEHLSDYITTNYNRITKPSGQVDFGHNSFDVAGIPVFWSRFATAQTLYMLNAKYLILAYATPKLLMPRNIELPTPIGEVRQMMFKGQVVSENQRFHAIGVNSGIS